MRCSCLSVPPCPDEQVGKFVSFGPGQIRAVALCEERQQVQRRHVLVVEVIDDAHASALALPSAPPSQLAHTARSQIAVARGCPCGYPGRQAWSPPCGGCRASRRTRHRCRRTLRRCGCSPKRPALPSRPSCFPRRVDSPASTARSPLGRVRLAQAALRMSETVALVLRSRASSAALAAWSAWVRAVAVAWAAARVAPS